MAPASSPSLPGFAALSSPQLRLIILQIFAQVQHDRDIFKSENQMCKHDLSAAEDRLQQEETRRMATEYQMNEQAGVFQAKTEAALETAGEVERLLKKAEQELSTAVDESNKFKELSAKKDALLLKLKNELEHLEELFNKTVDAKVIQHVSTCRQKNLQPSLEQSKEIEGKLLESMKKADNFERLALEREQQLQSAKEEIKNLQADLLTASQNAASCEAKYQISVEEVLNLMNLMKADKELLIQTWVTGNATVQSLQLALEAEKNRTREKEEQAVIHIAEENRRQNEKETKCFQEQQKLLQEFELERNRSLSLQLALNQNVLSGFANMSDLITSFGNKQEQCETEKRQLVQQLREEKRIYEERISAINQNILVVLQEVKFITSTNQQTSEYIKVTLLTEIENERTLRSSLQSTFESIIAPQMDSLMEALTLHHRNITETLDTYIITPKENRKKLPYILHGRPMSVVLLQSASAGNITELEILLDAGANIESFDDKYNETPLIWSAENGRVEACRFLLERGANMHARATNWGNRTSLHAAALNNKIHVIELLIELGADVNATDADGRTPQEVGDDNTKAWFSKFLSRSKP